MSTIALVLHDPVAGEVRELWSLLAEQYGLTGVRKVPFPHVTLLGFEDLDHPHVKPFLERLSQATAPFTLEASGVAYFSDPARILYAPVAAAPELKRLHQLVYEELTNLGARLSPFSMPERWVPHITLAQGEAPRASYGEAVEFLTRQKLQFQFEVRNLTLFDWIGPRYEPCDRFPLMGRELD